MLEEKLKYVQEKILSSAEKSSRELSEIKLIAVSKTHPISLIMQCYSAGVRDFGENKAIELRDKSELLKNDITWHFIGHLQTNKVKYIIKNSEYIHSVESLKLAEEINKRAKFYNKVQQVFVEMNTSNEASKFGLRSYDELYDLIAKFENLEHVKVIGLMTMAPFTDNEEVARKSFSRLREFRDRISNHFNSVTELSMGMTNDYAIAIEEGATMLRIGTAIFDKRDQSLSWSDK